MGLLIKNHLENAIEALKANRMRTMLTVTGVTIGVASITAVLSLASGAANFLSTQAVATKDSVALVRSNSSPATPDSLLADFQSLHTTTTLTEKDVLDIDKAVEASVAPMANLHTGIKAKDGAIDGKHATLVGSSPSLFEIANLAMLEGDFIADGSGMNGIVVGSQLAVDLFGTEHALGNILKIREETFTVIGVLKVTNQPINYLGVDFDRSAIVPVAAVKHFTQGVAQIQQIIISTENKAELTQIKKQVEELLLKNHLGEDDFMVLTGSAITAPSSKLFSSITVTVVIIAGISLLVGGIGIMNIMLVNVAERNREVGIRKAIGATSNQIINQFLIESAIVGLLGGIFGYALGLASSFILGMYLPFTPILEWHTAALSIGVAVATGILFGIYPAIRAANKDPIEALHQ